MLEIKITELKIADYDEIVTLWENTQGVRLRDVDSKENIERYLHLKVSKSNNAYKS